MTLLAQSQPESVLLMHPVYPLLFVAVVLGWAWIVEKLDKDAAYFYMPRYWLNLGHLAVGAIAMAAMMFIPWFGLGLLLGLALMVGSVVGYAFYRNPQVPERDRWSFSVQDMIRQLSERRQARAQRRAKMALMDPKQKPLPVPTGDDPLVPAHEVVEDLLEYAFEREGEIVDLAVNGQRAGAFARIDGVRYTYPYAIEPQLMRDAIEYLKEAAQLDLEEKRKRQIGQMYVRGEDVGEHELGIETAGSTRGMTMTITIDPSQRASSLPLEELGMLDAQIQLVRGVLEGATRNAVIVAGPRRNGLSTTLYSFLAPEIHDPYTHSIVTLEDEPLDELEGIHHNAIGHDTAPEKVNNTLAGLLRGDPHIVMLSHLADDKTAKTVAEHAGEVRFYFPLTEEDTFSSVRSWIKLVGDREQAADALGMVVAQRLVRKLCTECRVAYKPDAAALKKFNLPAEKVSKLYRSSGKIKVREDQTEPCPHCHGLAYRGRVGIFEVMVIDDEARKLIVAGKDDRLRAHLRKQQKMLMLQEAALQKVLKGITDIKEITRVLSSGEEDAARRKSETDAKQQQQEQPAK